MSDDREPSLSTGKFELIQARADIFDLNSQLETSRERRAEGS